MKKFISLMLALVMVFALCACGGNEADPAANEDVDYSTWTLDQLKAELKTVNEGKFTVATSPDFAPYEFYVAGDDGEYTIVGFDMAFAQYIADKLGLELEVIPMDFDGTISELGAKKVDVSMAGYSPDPKRESLMNFTNIYYEGTQSFVTTEAMKDVITSMEVANDPQYQIGAQTGSIQADLAAANTPDADNLNLAKVTDIVAELVSGKLDGAFIETVVAESYQKNYPELVIVSEVPYDQAGSAIGVNKDNEVLLAALNLIIDEALEDGTLGGFVEDANALAAGEHFIMVDGEIVLDE